MQQQRLTFWILMLIHNIFVLTLLSRRCRGCSCSGDIAVYRCIAPGGVSTVWQGSAFNCTGNRISLLHRINDEAYCNGRAIYGRIISTDHRNYTSVLNVNVSSILHGKTVECWYDNGTSLMHIRSYTIIVKSEPFPPPENLSISHLNSTHLSFMWSTVLSVCTTLHYKIHATDCGFCPPATVNPEMTCGGIILDGRVCTVQIETSFCDQIVGNLSVPVSVTLKAPRAPIISRVIPRYYTDTLSFLPGRLMKIEVKFYSEDLYFTSNMTYPTIYYPTLSYTIVFATSGRTCNTSLLTSSNCIQNEVCTYLFDISTSFCPSNVDLVTSVFAINPFGEGEPSDSVLVAHVNRFVSISFDAHLMSIFCRFVNIRENSTKTCSIQYVSGNVCLNKTLMDENHSMSNVVNVKLTHLIGRSSLYCYTISACDGSSSLITEGYFYTECDPLLLGSMPQKLATSCDPPFKSLVFNGGIVCYTTNVVGASAFFYCLDCGFSSIRGMSVRTCMEDGTWNGSTPACECQTTNKGIAFEILYVLGTGFCIVLIFMVITIAVCCISRGRVKRELKSVHNELNQLSVVYEELDTNVHQPSDNTIFCDSLDKNVAYTIDGT